MFQFISYAFNSLIAFKRHLTPCSIVKAYAWYIIGYLLCLLFYELFSLWIFQRIMVSFSLGSNPTLKLCCFRLIRRFAMLKDRTSFLNKLNLFTLVQMQNKFVELIIMLRF